MKDQAYYDYQRKETARLIAESQELKAEFERRFECVTYNFDALEEIYRKSLRIIQEGRIIGD